MTTELISEQILDEEIFLDSSDINDEINDILTIKLKDKLEGRCINSGFIIKNSIIIINRSIHGRCVGNNKIMYNIKFKTRIVSPILGSIISCYINNVTKAGVVAYIKLSDYDGLEGHLFTDSPLKILIPIKRFENTDINTGSKINIMITAKRIKYKNTTIQVIGRPV